MNPGKAIALGCVVAVALTGLVGVVTVGGFLYHVSQDPVGVAVSVDVPLDVTVGETFPLVVTVTNEREGETLSMNDIDIAEEYLAGFIVVSTDPVEKSSMHIPLDNTMSYTHDVDIAPGESRDFTFNLRAEETGVFRGEVDVTEGMRFTSTVAQTVVGDVAEQPVS